jgi:hypothetical protein
MMGGTMGLDITAYKKLTPVVGELKRDEYGCLPDQYWEPHALDWSNRTFPGSGNGLSENAVYKYDDCFGFRAGSYSGYGQWRDDLARFAGYGSAKECWDKAANGPFYELINFADNEGVIGPIVAKKLAKDFADNAERAKSFANDDTWWLEQYTKWQKAFEMAADDGAVDFH